MLPDGRLPSHSRPVGLQSVELKLTTDIEYSRPDGFPLHFDLYHPGGASVPVIVCVHGGGWISGDKSMYAEEAEWIASQGFAALTFDYRLAPLHTFPAPIEDCRELMKHIRGHAGDLSIDGGRVAALGNSAGGHLATMLGVVGEVQAVVDVCGITDLRNPSETHYPISMSFVEQFLGGSYEGLEGVYRDASPVFHISGKTCPFFIAHGTEDDVVPPSQSALLAEALRAQGTEVTLLELDGEGHSFTHEAWEKIRAGYIEFLSDCFGKK